MWSCECPDHTHRKVMCKHISNVRFWLKIRNKRKGSFVIPELQKQVCPYCKSTQIIKRGMRMNMGEPKQRYSCQKCGKRFVADVCPKFKGSDKTITAVMDMWYKGMSVRQIQDHLKQFHNFKVHYSTIYRWIVRFSDKISGYVGQFTPELSGRWHADEQFVLTRTDGTGERARFGYCWNVMDSSTRFLIASKLTQYRGEDEANGIMMEARQRAGIAPNEIITDRLRAYPKAIRGSFPTARHYRYRGFMDSPQNNKIERYHGSFRSRDKVMRGLKSVKTAQGFTNGFRMYYNFLRPHMGLNNLTPAQVAGIGLGLNGGNRWLELLKMAKGE